MAAPNVVNEAGILGKTVGAALGTTVTTNILTCSADKVLKINSIIVSNVDGSNATDATVSFYDSSSTKILDWLNKSLFRENLLWQI